LDEQPTSRQARRARILRNAIILALAAAAVYGTFILMMAERGQGVT